MIVNPLNNRQYSLFSVSGRNILKAYISNYKNGGMKRKRTTRSEHSDPTTKKWPRIDGSHQADIPLWENPRCIIQFQLQTLKVEDQ